METATLNWALAGIGSDNDRHGESVGTRDSDADEGRPRCGGGGRFHFLDHLNGRRLAVQVPTAAARSGESRAAHLFLLRRPVATLYLVRTAAF